METSHDRGWNQFSRRTFLRNAGGLGIATWLLPSTSHSLALPAEPSATAAGTYEYAAGEITLPFRYEAKRSPAPKPPGLDFQHQLNPDNCQVFVRIDDELWEFRSQWIINLGTAARYKGPDIDHMVRVEDAIYPDGMTSCWFLGGMWYDRAEKKLYAPMHVEHDGVRRTYPFSRKIALAISLDKGRTWQYQGDILTPETYYYPHDFFKFSGFNYGNGLADFGFYVDQRGGYFYLFPDEGWAPRSTRGTRWNTRAARCAISEKMAPGKWVNFYEGKWDQPGLGGKSSVVAPGHFWGVTYSTVLDRYICMFPANQDPPDEPNTDGVYIGACKDLTKQDWVWGHCPEAMFGFTNLIKDDGTDVADTCGDTFRHYAYFNAGDFQRLDIKLFPGETMAAHLQPRYLFAPHPESSDSVLGRSTKIVGSRNAEMKYMGTWKEEILALSYEGTTMQSSVASSSVEFSFAGPDIYWRALHSPHSGIADIYIDGVLRKRVDCYSPRSTSYEQFLYICKALASGAPHTIKVVVTGKKNTKSSSAAIHHIAFESSAESYRASGGFSAIMGKNNWVYQQLKQSASHDLLFTEDEAHPRLYWVGSGDCQVGLDYQIPGEGAAVRKWVAPHGGSVRIEGAPICGGDVSASVWLNADSLWSSDSAPDGKTASHDLNCTVMQGDAISFIVTKKTLSQPSSESSKATWDPVVTFASSVPTVWIPNQPSARNLALSKAVRSKVLVSRYRPFDAVDGDLNTAFTLHGDDKLSKGDDCLQVDLENSYLIDNFLVSSQTADPAYRPHTFSLQKSDDGLSWTDVDSVSGYFGMIAHYYGIPMMTVTRAVPAFRSRYVRLYLPEGKPFTISEFALFYTEGKTFFGPPIPAG
jgi:hypothetical protein